MAYELVKVETLKGGLSEAVLAEHSSLADIPGERELKKPRLKYLQERAEVGDFNRCEWARCHCLEDKRDYRVNGNHSRKVLEGILSEDIDAEFPKGVPVTVQWYTCDTLLDLADVFDQFDNQKSSRKPDDKLGVYIAQHSDLIGLDKRLINAVLAGVDWGIKHLPDVAEVCGDHRADSAYDRGRLLDVEDVREFIDLMNEYRSAAFSAWKVKSGILASMFLRFIRDRKEAALLIEQTVNEVGEEAEAYAKAIRTACTKVGKDQGYFFRSTEKHLQRLHRIYTELGPKAVEAMIREVLAEQQEASEAAAD